VVQALGVVIVRKSVLLFFFIFGVGGAGVFFFFFFSPLPSPCGDRSLIDVAGRPVFLLSRLSRRRKMMSLGVISRAFFSFLPSFFFDSEWRTSSHGCVFEDDSTSSSSGGAAAKN